MAYRYITLVDSDRIVRLTLNRPGSLNAINRGMLNEIADAIDVISNRNTVRVLVVTGAGRAFSSGVDLSENASSSADQGGTLDASEILARRFNPLFERLMALPVPIITAVNGPAAGAGCSLALAGDFVIAARSAYFLMAFVNIGLVPDVGSTWLLPRLIGIPRAKAMMILGERIPAEIAESWGMIYKVTDDAQLEMETTDFATRLSKGPTYAYSLIRKGVLKCAETSLAEALDLEQRHQAQAAKSHDAMEGVAAFRARRSPIFAGR